MGGTAFHYYNFLIKKTPPKNPKKLKGDALSLISCQLENNARMTKHEIF